MKHLLISFIIIFSSTAFSQTRYIHVLVALCDNENQGIIPVPKKIGNGRDPVNNLYWGCKFGVKTFFRNRPEWRLITSIKDPASQICERLVFEHKDSSVYLIADAYRGNEIKQAIIDFLNYASGLNKICIPYDSSSICAGGSSDLVCYVGHDGLMDFDLDTSPSRADASRKEVIILACASKVYFSSYLIKTGAHPILWTTGLMCPEAYTLNSAIDSWIRHDTPNTRLEKAARTYNYYQKCGIRGAKKIFTFGY